MNISAAQFSTNLAALSSQILVPIVGGRTVVLTIKALGSDIPVVIPERNCPILIPAYKYQTGESTPRLSMGEDAFREDNWTANYVLIYAPVGTNRTGAGVEYGARIAQAVHAIKQVVIANPTALGVNDVMFSSDEVPSSPIIWLNGDQYYGATIQIGVEDFRNL